MTTTVTVAYDLSAAATEGALRDKLIELGWTPPDEQSITICPKCFTVHQGDKQITEGGSQLTRDDIIRMAREAGGADIACNGWTSWVGTQSTEFLERFAAQVDAVARNAGHLHGMNSGLKIGADQEREACLGVCKKVADSYLKDGTAAGSHAASGAEDCMTDIRARSQA